SASACSNLHHSSFTHPLQHQDLHSFPTRRSSDLITFIIERKHDLIIVVHIPDMDEYPHKTDQQNNIKCKTDQSFILFQSLRFHRSEERRVGKEWRHRR